MDVDVQYSNYTDDFFGDGEYVNLFGSRKRKKALEEKKRTAQQEAERLRLESEKLIAEAKAAEAEADKKRLEALQIREKEVVKKDVLQPKETIIESTVVAQPQKKTGKFVPYIIGGVILIGGLVYFLRKK